MHNAQEPDAVVVVEYLAEFPDGLSQLVFVQKEEISIDLIAKSGVPVNIRPDVAKILCTRYDVISCIVWPDFDTVPDMPAEQGLQLCMTPDHALLSIVDDPETLDTQYRKLGFSHNVEESFWDLGDANEFAIRLFHRLSAPTEMNESDRIFCDKNVTAKLNEAMTQLRARRNMATKPFTLEFTAPYQTGLYTFPYRYLKVQAVKTNVNVPRDIGDWIDEPEKCIFPASLFQRRNQAAAPGREANEDKQLEKGEVVELNLKEGHERQVGQEHQVNDGKDTEDERVPATAATPAGQVVLEDVAASHTNAVGGNDAVPESDSESEEETAFAAVIEDSESEVSEED
jgi:hypothetical protein